MTDPTIDSFATAFDISALSKQFDLEDEGKVNQPPKKQKLSQETSDKENSPNGTRDDSDRTPTNPNASPLSEAQTPLNKHQLAIAERLARQLHEMEKKKQEDHKKKKNNEEASYKNVRKKVDEQRQKIEQEEKHAHRANLELYKLFNDLQGTAKDLNITFDYPEIVVVGMQSDGKSSFVEGLLGFQFNIVETNIGTRRPLIIQMINNPSKDVPSCRFRKEYPIPDQDPFEDRDTAVHDLVDEITRRTNERAGVGSDKVSDVPIILRVEFKECANLTIIDTPGFRLGGDERLKIDIARMVWKLIEPKHRIIVCLDQSTVEWANSTSRPIVRKIDPEFSRTILVNTKFDNRVKELRNKQSADGYLTGENLPPNARPFFISMPVRRNLDSGRFKDQIRECFLEDYEKLLEVSFDEKKYIGQLGMFRVKSYLERLLNEKYQQSLAPTLRTLEELAKKTEVELSQIKTQLQQHDIKQLMNSANTYVQCYVNHVENLLAGSIAGEPDKNGEALNEEKLNSGVAEWPDFTFDFDIPNSKLKVYGGAQYARLLNEFEYVAHSREFPVTSLSEIASALGASKSGYCAPEAAAANLVQMKAKQIFLPLIDIVLQRCTYIMKRLFNVAIHVIRHDRDNKSIGILTVYDKFVLELKNTYDLFIDNIEKDCKARLKDDFIMFTKIVDWDLLMSSASSSSNTASSTNSDGNSTYNYLQPSADDTKQRVKDIMEKKPLNWMSAGNSTGSVRMDEEGYKHVAVIAAKMFSGIRYFFAKYVRNKLNAFFLDPILHDVGVKVVNHFYKLNEKKYEEMFLDGVSELKEQQNKLENQFNMITQQRDRFKETYYRMKSSSSPLPHLSTQ